MKTIKTLYGGDATNQKELEHGDYLTTELLDTAIMCLLKKHYSIKYSKKINKEIIETIVSLGTKQVIIYTKK